MFKFDAQLIQVELGSKAMEVFKTKDNRGLIERIVGQEPPGWADYLIHITNILKNKLKKEGIDLPDILFIPSPETPPDIFRITLGVAGKDFDVFKDNFLDKLEEKVRAYHVPNLTKEKVDSLLDKALGYVLQKKFQQAMELLMHIYYLSSLIEHQSARIVSLLNMGGICLLNNQLNATNLLAKQAQLLVDKDAFYDPYLKYYTHKMLANVAALNKMYEDSSALFEQAFTDIEPSGENGYMIDALFNKASILLYIKSYEECIDTLDRIVSYIKYSADYNKELLVELYEMRAFIADITIGKLKADLNDLQKEYDYLSRSFLLKAKDTLLTLVSKCGPSIITFFVGNVTGGDKNLTVNQNNVNGHNIIGLGVKIN